MASTAAKRIQSSSLLRITLFQLVVLLVFAGLGFRLWRLQAVAGAQYSEMAQRNRMRLITTDAARGVMYDRTNALPRLRAQVQASGFAGPCVLLDEDRLIDLR